MQAYSFGGGWGVRYLGKGEFVIAIQVVLHCKLKLEMMGLTGKLVLTVLSRPGIVQLWLGLLLFLVEVKVQHCLFLDAYSFGGFWRMHYLCKFGLVVSIQVLLHCRLKSEMMGLTGGLVLTVWSRPGIVQLWLGLSFFLVEVKVQHCLFLDAYSFGDCRRMHYLCKGGMVVPIHMLLHCKLNLEMMGLTGGLVLRLWSRLGIVQLWLGLLFFLAEVKVQDCLFLDAYSFGDCWRMHYLCKCGMVVPIQVLLHCKLKLEMMGLAGELVQTVWSTTGIVQLWLGLLLFLMLKYLKCDPGPAGILLCWLVGAGLPLFLEVDRWAYP